jgi:3D (Asp-Asp-Asp) domain-containing protein
MKRVEIGRVLAAGLIAAACIEAGIQLPGVPPGPLQHPPVVVYSDVMLPPLVVRAHRIIRHVRGKFDRAPVGKEIRVSLTQYCLQGTTRRDNYVREGIVAADPRVFPLARYVEVFLGKHYLGRFLVDDTGRRVKGPTLDIWTPSCAEARRFGRHWGTAMLAVK